MEFTASSDLKAVCGATLLVASPNGEQEEPKMKKKEKDKGKEKADKRKQALSGLDMGRKLLVVLKKDDVAGGGKSSTQAVRVVDHGAKQKEAIRRLFDAQVLLKSYEEQLQDAEAQVTSLQIKLSREMHVNFKVIQGTSELALETPPDPQESKRAEHLEKIRKYKEGQALEETPADPDKVVIPFWIRQDETSRLAVSKLQAEVMDTFNTEGSIDKEKLKEQLWSVGFEFAMRWAGNPSEEVQKLYKHTLEKNKDIQRDAMKESSMLRSHIGKIQSRFKDMQKMSRELQQNYGRLQALAQQQAAVLNQMTGGRGAPGAGGRPTPGNFTMPMMPGSGGASPMASDGFEQRRGTANVTSSGAFQSPPPGRQGVDMAASARAGEMAQRAMAATASGSEALNTSVTEFRGFDVQAALGTSKTQAFDFNSMSLGGAPSLGDIAASGKFEGGFGVPDEDIEAMDHELFEPLNSFDAETRELLIDAVNDKVRRILGLDPDNFKDGRMPYGIRPNTDGSELQGQLQELARKLAAMRQERDDLKKALDQALAEIAALKGRKVQRIQPQAAPEPGRPEPVFEEVEQIISPEALQALYDKIAQLEQQLRNKDADLTMKDDTIAGLQAQLKAKNDELAELQAKLREAERKIADLEKTLKNDNKAQRIQELEGELRKMRAQKDMLATKVAELEKLNKEMEEQIAKLQEDLKRALARKPPEPGAPPPAETVVETVVKMDYALVKTSQDQLRKLLQKVSDVCHMDPLTSGQKKLDRLSGPDDEVLPKAMPILEEYTGEAILALAAYERMVADLRDQLANKPRPPPPAAVVEDRSEEVRALKKTVREQENEISRLLLLIDELRKRIEALEAIEIEDPEVQVAVNSIMDKVGLRELMTAKKHGMQKLKGVFERLWQDSAQRIQRHGLIRERALLANNAFSAVSSAINGQAESTEAITDFERLSETTAATLKGMWYRTERIFRRACEYAMTSALESQSMRAQRELTEGVAFSDINAEDGFSSREDSLIQPSYGSSKRSSRLAARRSDRPHKVGFSPSKPKGSPGGDKPSEETPSFAAYVQAMREANNKTNDETKASPSQRFNKGSNDANAEPKTLKQAVHHPQGLSTSQSLPALPKGRATFNGENVRAPSPAGSAASKTFVMTAAPRSAEVLT